MTSCHDVTKPDLPISACRCARNLIFFHGFSGHWVQKCHWFFNCVMPWRHDIMSCHHVMTSLNLIYLSQLVDVLESLFFLFSMVFMSLSSKMLLIFYLCDAVTSWRHVMTSLNLIHSSHLVEVLESWFFFCFRGHLGHWVHKCWYFLIILMFSCNDVISWRHKNCFTYQVMDLLEKWSCSWFHDFSGCLFL